MTHIRTIVELLNCSTGFALHLKNNNSNNNKNNDNIIVKLKDEAESIICCFVLNLIKYMNIKKNRNRNDSKGYKYYRSFDAKNIKIISNDSDWDFLEKERKHLPKFNIFCSLCQRGLGWTKDVESKKENGKKENKNEYNDYSPDFIPDYTDNGSNKSNSNSNTVYCFSEVTYNVRDFQDFNNDDFDNFSNLSE